MGVTRFALGAALGAAVTGLVAFGLALSTAQEPPPPLPPLPPVLCGIDPDCSGRVDLIDVNMSRANFFRTYRTCHQVQDADPGDPLIIEGQTTPEAAFTVSIQAHGAYTVLSDGGGYWRAIFTAQEGGPFLVSDGLMPMTCWAVVLPVVTETP